jgi:hypothetical protein
MPIDAVAAWLIPGIGLVSGLVATYVSLQNRALLAEARKELAELESRIILRLNGLYEQNPLPICLRPEVLVKATKA